MVCYIVPLAAGIITAIRRRALHRKDKEGFWLNLMFAGASLFGVVDHLWNDVTVVLKLEIDEIGLPILNFVNGGFFPGIAIDVSKGFIVKDGAD